MSLLYNFNVLLRCLLQGGGHCAENNDSSLTWPQTPVGLTYVQNCPSGQLGVAKRLCHASNATWDEVDTTGCYSEELQSILDEVRD